MPKPSRTVLVIENFTHSSETYENYLLQDPLFSYTILTEKYGNVIIDICRQQKIDAIIVDLQKSDSKNLIFIRKIKEKMGENCPPVVIIDDGDVEIAVQALKQGAADYLIKNRLTASHLQLAMQNAIDITNSKVAEAHLKIANRSIEMQQSQQCYRDLVEAMPQMVWMADATGNINYFNQRWYEYTGLSETSSMDVAKINTIHPDERQRSLEKWSQAVTNSECFEIEYRLCRWDGIYHWFISRGIPLKNSEGQVTAWVGTITDVDDIKQAETAIRQSEYQVRQVLDSLFSFVGMMTPEGVLIQANRTALKAAYLQEEDVIGKFFEETYWWSYSPEIQAQLRAAIKRAAEGEVIRYDVQVRLGENNFIIIDFALVPVLNNSGKVEYLIPSGIDITERKQAEAALRESQAQLQQQLAEIEAIYQSAPIGLNVLDNQLRFVRINQRLAEMNGLPVAAHIGRTVRELLPALADTAEQVLLPILQTGEALLNVEIIGETPAMPGVERTWLEHFLPLKDGDKVIGISTVCEEITQRKQIEQERLQAEKALRESEERFRTLADNIAQLVWMADENGSIFWYNRRWFDYTGTTLEEMQNGGWQKVHHPDYVERVRQKFHQSLERGEIWEDTFPLRSQNGEYHWFLSRAIPIRDDKGKVVRWFGTNTDITEAKQAEEEKEKLLKREQTAREAAEQANRIKDEFLAVLSHELRTPLNPILGWAKLLQEREFSPEKSKQALAIIERNAKLQVQLIDDLLDIARIIRGKIALNWESVEPVQLVAAAVETVRLAAEAKSIDLEIVRVAAIQPVQGDPRRLQQVIWNLLSNAIKFTPAGGKVTVRLEQVGNQAQIQVIDTGKGINPSFLPHIGELFRQQDSSTTRQFGGLGLGLAISRQLVEMHSGTLTAHSLGEGQGATFTVLLPLMRLQGPVSSSLVVQQTRNLQGVRVLVVDDEVDSLEVLTVLLEREGAIATTACSGQQALQKLAESQFDVLVCDIGMPLMDGYVLLRQIRSLPAHQGGNIRAIALTAYAAEQDRQQILSGGYQLHLPKPVDPDMLVKAIHSLIVGWVVSEATH